MGRQIPRGGEGTAVGGSGEKGKPGGVRVVRRCEKGEEVRREKRGREKSGQPKEGCGRQGDLRREDCGRQRDVRREGCGRQGDVRREGCGEKLPSVC